MEINKQHLQTLVGKIMHPKKGILAADESNGTANKRFKPLGIEESEEMRRRYRELLITTPDIENYLSGIILYDETIRQMTDEGELFRDILKEKGIAVGIKVDRGLKPFAGSSIETITQGLETLNSMLPEYAQMGATFTKWRAAFPITKDGNPTDSNIRENAKILAQYALKTQENGMVPIVEPEVLLRGGHSIDDAERVTERVISVLFDELKNADVFLGGLILKTSMVVAGSENKAQASHEMVARKTVSVLRNTVPPQTGGVVFLSGGQLPEYAVHNLDAIAKLSPHPWPVTFSFSRAIQEPVLAAWNGNNANIDKARKFFIERLILNANARQGKLEHSPGKVNEHHVTGLRGFFWVIVLLLIIFLIIF